MHKKTPVVSLVPDGAESAKRKAFVKYDREYR